MGILHDWYITTGNAGRLCVLPERMMKNRESLRHIKCTGIVDAVEQLKNYEGGALNAVPAANVREDVQGKWLEPDYPICCAIKCSVCGETEYLDDPDQYEHWNFCPNCGAQMTGGGEQ